MSEPEKHKSVAIKMDAVRSSVVPGGPSALEIAMQEARLAVDPDVTLLRSERLVRAYADKHYTMDNIRYTEKSEFFTCTFTPIRAGREERREGITR